MLRLLAARRPVLHPLLFAAAYVLSVAIPNQVELAGFIRPLLVAIGIGVVLTLIGTGVSRSWGVGGLLASTAIFALLSLGPLVSIWRAALVALGASLAAGVVAAIIGLGIGWLAWLVVRVRRGRLGFVPWATRSLNLIAAFAVLVTITPALTQSTDGVEPESQIQQAVLSDRRAPADARDIYVIVLDTYPRADVLQRRFGFDNSAFLGALDDAGFDVSDDSMANYAFTQLTLASMFQMRYVHEIDGLREHIGEPGPHPAAFRRAMNEAPAFDLLKQAGYEIVVVPTSDEHVRLRGASDRDLEHGQLTDVELHLIERTWALDALSAFLPNLYVAHQAERVEHALDDIATLAAEPVDTPRFVFIHIPLPHLPIILNADGSLRDVDSRSVWSDDPRVFGMTDAEFAAAFVDQLRYLNQRVLETVTAIQASADREPVIVVMSDHGYKKPLSDVQARLATLFAASTPGHPRLLADAPTPVNLMPRLLNAYLGLELPTVTARYFLAPSHFNPLELAEVPIQTFADTQPVTALP